MVKVVDRPHGEMATGCDFVAGGTEVLSCADDKVLCRTNVDELHAEPVCSLDGFPTALAYCPSANDKQASDTAGITFSDGSLSILQVSSGREEKKVQAYTAGAAISLAWSLDGAAIATGGEDGVVKVWSRTGMLRNTVATMRHPIHAVCWGRGDALLFSSGKLLTIEHKQQKQVQWKAADGTILCAHWNPVTNLIVSGGEDRKYRVWDAYGRQLFASAPLEHVVMSVAWSPSGSNFAVGSFNLLKVCDRTGWTTSREDLSGSGSVMSVRWSQDGTVVAGTCANGSVIVSEIANKVIEVKHIRATMIDSRQVEVQNSLEDTTESLAFRERVVDLSMDHGYLAVQTSASQVHLYRTSDFAAPAIVDVPESRSSVLVLANRHFLAGWTVFTYEGRRVASAQCFNGVNVALLDRNTVALNDKMMAVVENSRDAIRLVSLEKGKPIALIKHKLSIVQIALGDDDLLAFLDGNGDLFVQANGKKTFKLPCTMVESIRFNESGALVVAADGGNKLQVFFYPGVVWVDPDLLADTTITKETPQFATKQPQIISFADHLVTVREHTGALSSLSTSRYPSLLLDLVRQRKWEDAIRLCRFVEQRFLWALLAAKALDKCHLDSAEIGLASLQNVAKLNYILYIKDLPSEKARVAELALYKRDIKSAETVLLQSNPPLLYRAVKLNLRMHRWERAKEIALPQPKLVRMVELYKKQYTQQQTLSSSELKELKAIKLKFSDKPPEDDDDDDEEEEEESEQEQQESEARDESSRPDPASSPKQKRPVEAKGADSDDENPVAVLEGKHE